MTICSLSHAAYISRMAMVRPRAPAVFRPGVVLQRPWYQRVVPAYRPYVVYRGPIPHRYAIKPHMHFRNAIPSGPWKTGRPPVADYELLRAASAPPLLHAHGDTGAIHTIPAPNLSLSEKPIVVVDTDTANTAPATEPIKTYEVTEKYSEPQVYQIPAKIEAPTGFSKQSSLKTPELHQFVQNGASFPLSAQYGHPTLPLPQNPQQFSIQGFPDLSPHQDLQTAAEGIIIPPSALYQNDPNFLQKLQSQLLQQFPAVEFIPYTAEIQPQIQQTTQSELYLLENEVITQQPSFKSDEPHKNIVQRETQEASLMSIVPQPFAPSNVTQNGTHTTPNDQENATETSGTELPTTTKLIETTTEQTTTPIYYAQVGQSIGNIIAKGFYSAINDVRAAAALAQVEKVNELAHVDITTTIKSETAEANESLNKESNEINLSNEINFAGAPFEKTADSVNFTYRVLRSQEDSKNKNGNVYAGQLVQAMISEDKDFNKGKANVSWRAPLRLFAATEKKDNPQKLNVVKAKIPPKTKLTFDDKTGEPVLRIYASYSENPIQKEVMLSKLSNLKHVKEVVTRKQDAKDSWNTVTSKPFEKTIPDASISQFGLKLRSRSDDYIPLFEEYEE
ncbi:PREDICTED: uncharacterized protein LOC106103564 isoform X2 [Papilio polytes]|uniref:uncharacterized protein LOC106103564 isoform X2 n=1 Tax=Papilio polytes TaxID=76194 RepID=UPI00067681DD|nr:PREDICTED: uncharacterized protein LOC106103564 isoform X2 [Papilio polytes]